MLDVPAPRLVMPFLATSPAASTDTLPAAASFPATPKTVFEVARLSPVALKTVGRLLAVSKPVTQTASPLAIVSPFGTVHFMFVSSCRSGAPRSARGGGYQLLPQAFSWRGNS